MMLPVRFARRIGLPTWTNGGTWDPFEELERFSGRALNARNLFEVSVDLRETDNAYVIEADVPGLKKDEVEITFQDGVLTISGERKEEQRHEGESHHVVERRTGKFTRSFRLPDDVKPDTVEARMTDGVLKVTVEKAEQVKPRRIEVKTK